MISDPSLAPLFERNPLGTDDAYKESCRLRAVGEPHPQPALLSQIDELTTSLVDALSRAKKSDLPALHRYRLTLGASALMLSGGGSITMYHLGTIRSLITSGVYGSLKVVSGTSGGSIAAAMCAIKTEEELTRDVCVNEVSTDYMRTGEQGKRGIRWFPKTHKMAAYWLRSRLLVPSEEVRRSEIVKA